MSMLYMLQSIGKRNWIMSGSFAPNGSLAVNNDLNTSCRGDGARSGFTVTRTAAGTFTVTIQDNLRYTDFVWTVTGPTFATARCLQRNFSAGNTPTATVVISNAAGTAIDLSANPDTAVEFIGVVTDTLFRG